MSSHYAKLDNSPRLQRVLALLAGGRECSTRDIIQAAGVCAVNAIIHELRLNGHDIQCRCIARGVYIYWIPGAGAEKVA